METPVTTLPVYKKDVPYTKANGENGKLDVPFFELPKGTLLFRGVQLPNPKKDEDPRMFVRDWLGYPNGEQFCMTPTHNTFFYTSPYVPFGAHTVGDWFNAIMVYQTVKDLRLVCMISPSSLTRGGREIKALDGSAPIQRCDKFDYTCFESKTSAEVKKEKELQSFDNCLHPDFVREHNVSGWMAIADYDSLDNFKEGLKGKDTTMGKYIMELDKRLPGKGVELLTSTYTDDSRHRGFPEIVLFPWSPHPGTENQYTEARTEEDAADAIAEMSDRFNYLPIACITERGILEAFTGDFKAGDLPKFAASSSPGPLTRKAVDKFQSDYLTKMMTEGKTLKPIGDIQVVFDKRTGFYMMSGFQGWYTNPVTKAPSPYNDFMLSLATPEEREKVLEYKIKYRSFDASKFQTNDTFIDGTPMRRDFIFDRPDQLYPQFKELGLRLPSKLVPYIWEATETFQKNMANRKRVSNVRGAEEAMRRAAEAKEKIQESLDFIAKKKAEYETKQPSKKAETFKSKPLPLPFGPPPGQTFAAPGPKVATPESFTPPLGARTPDYFYPPVAPAELTGVQTTIPILRSYEEAFALGKAVLQLPDLKTVKFNPTALNPSYERPWEINENSLTATLKYIFEFVHNTCYMLCVYEHEPYLFKLEPGGMNPKVKGILEEEIAKKGITDINLDNTRIMQCILKPYGQETVAAEWLGFLQNVKGSQWLPNGIFILNLTDAVILRNDGNEPFGYFTKGLVKMDTYFRKSYFLPIFAYSGHVNYDDVPIPNFDDVFEIKRSFSGAVDERLTLGDDVVRDWGYKSIEKAVFRGGTTGCGLTAKTNLRIQLCDPDFKKSLKNKDMLDVGLTTITKQYKMDMDIGLGKLNPSNFTLVEPLTIEQQSQYKYIIHVDGNVHAYRLLKTMLTGSCILRVMSPYQGWADSALRGYDILNDNMDPNEAHYIVVRPNDLSYLDTVLDWCKENDQVCAKIGNNAREFALELLKMENIEAAFANLLNGAVITAMSGGGNAKEKGTRKQVKKQKRKTRKQKRGSKEEPLVLAKWRGGGVDDEVAEYVQGTMAKVWKNYLERLR